MNEMNQHKTFAFVFSIGMTQKWQWSGDEIKALLERATAPEREELRGWMERCKPGGFLILAGGCAICTGMEEDLQTLTYIDDDGSGETRKSERVFQENRHLVYPIQQVTISWDGEMVQTETQVHGADGSIISLSGFGIGFQGTGFTGMTWLLDQCGISYDKEMLARMDIHSPGALTLYPLEQSATLLEVWAWGDQWEGRVQVQRSNGKPLELRYPLDRGMLYDDLTELIDILLYDCKVRGIEWTADPRLTYNIMETEIPEGWMEISKQQSERIGWNE